MGQCASAGGEAEARAISLAKAGSLPSKVNAIAPGLLEQQAGRRLGDDYEVDGKVLGQGLGGDVVLVRGRSDRQSYALKTVRRGGILASTLQQLTTEVEVYLALDHPNIARLHGVYERGVNLYLLMECCEGGELYARLQKRGVFPDADAADAARQMLRAVGYLHSINVVHRDLKLENFLYTSKDDAAQLKLIDFGFAKVWDPSTLMMAPCGSISYVSPDVLDGKGYTNKCDLWSLGVIVWMLLVGYPPFHGDESQVMDMIKAGTPDWKHKSRWSPVTADAVEFVKKLLEKDPRQRPGAKEALQEPWLLRFPRASDGRPRPKLAGA